MKLMMRISPVHIGHVMRYYRAVKAIFLLEKFVVGHRKFNKIAIEELPQGGFLRLTPPIYPQILATLHFALLLALREQS